MQVNSRGSDSRKQEDDSSGYGGGQGRGIKVNITMRNSAAAERTTRDQPAKANNYNLPKPAGRERAWLLWSLLGLAIATLLTAGNNWHTRAATNRFVAAGGSDTSNDCSNPGSPCATIGHAVSQSAAGDTINVAAGTYIEHVIVSQSVSILGDPILGSTVDGTKTGSVVTINDGVTAMLSGLTMINGNGSSSFDIGGGISNNGTLTVTGCTIKSSQAITGAGIYNRGFFGQSTLTVVDTIIRDNLAGIGGGIYNNAGSATVMNTTITGNSASISAGIHNHQGAVLTVTGTSISGNSAANNGGIGNDSGATLTLINSTINGNFAATAVGGIINVGTATLVNTTIFGNSTGSIGGPKGLDNRTTLSLINTIIGGSQNGVDCASAGTLINSHNLVQDGSCGPAVSGDPKLGPLQNNGGSTFTQALLPGSPAIDAGDDSVLGPPFSLTTDQRGTGFPRGFGSHVDIGAFEVILCTITCPANITTGTGPGATQCCAAVTYSAPITTGTCGTVNCSPASGSCFAVGTTTVDCSEPGGANCSFRVTVTDTTPPTIVCPTNVKAVGTASCPTATGVKANFTVTATDNCPGVTVACSPASGSTFPAGTTTVTCTATDASGNRATCSFTVSTFSFCLQDETNPGKVVFVNAQTGDYIFCCDGVQIASGRGTITTRGCIGSIDHVKGDRRVHIQWDTSANGGAGTAIVQKGPSLTTVCQITDKKMANNTCVCSNVSPASAKSKS